MSAKRRRPKPSHAPLPVIEVTSEPCTETELQDAECILFLPLTAQLLNPRNKSWQSDVLLQYNPDLPEPAAYEPDDVGLWFHLQEDKEKLKVSVAGVHTATVATWPSSSSVCCAHCSHVFAGAPVFLPRSIHPVSVYAHVVFCSFACARTYNEDVMGGIRTVTDTNMMLTALLSAMAGKYQPVRRAPARHMLALFGGSMTIEQFRVQEPTLIYFPPLLPLSVMTEKIQPVAPVATAVPVRRKPLTTSFSRIESCLTEKG